MKALPWIIVVLLACWLVALHIRNRMHYAAGLKAGKNKESIKTVADRPHALKGWWDGATNTAAQ